MKPLIGISSNYRESQQIRFVPDTDMLIADWQMVPGNYIRAIENAGGVPIILPVVEREDTLYEFIDRLSGILFTGGADIAAWRYGMHVRNGHGRIDETRDRHELNLARRVLYSTKLPILGICRGLQLMNIAAGGTLYQDIERDNKDAFIAHSIPHPIADNTLVHEVGIRPDTRISAAVGEQKIMVNSFHHQAIEELGAGFRASAFAPDGCIEAIEFEFEPSRFIVGVQWHPEALDSRYGEHAAIFSAFVSACGEYAGAAK